MSDSTKPDILIGVMGVTGSGKSTFIQTMSKDLKIVVGKKRQSCTKNVQSCNSFEIDGRIVELVDTPGFSDSELTDTQVLELIGDWMKEKFDMDQKLHGILYIHRITDNRMDGAAVRSLAVFHNICGPDFLSNTVMVTSMWDKLREPEDITDAEDLEVELKEDEWESLLSGGAMYARSYNTQQCCEAIVRKIVAKSPKTPKLQAELGAGVDLGDTAAGAGLRSELDKQAKLHKEQLEMIVQQHAQALQDGERKMVAVLAKAQAEREAQVIQDRNDQEKLRTTLERQITDLKNSQRAAENQRAADMQKAAENQKAADMANIQRTVDMVNQQRAADMANMQRAAENQRAADIANMQWAVENQRAADMANMQWAAENQRVANMQWAAESQRAADIQRAADNESEDDNACEDDIWEVEAVEGSLERWNKWMAMRSALAESGTVPFSKNKEKKLEEYAERATQWGKVRDQTKLWSDTLASKKTRRYWAKKSEWADRKSRKWWHNRHVLRSK